MYVIGGLAHTAYLPAATKPEALTEVKALQKKYPSVVIAARDTYKRFNAAEANPELIEIKA